MSLTLDERSQLRDAAQHLLDHSSSSEVVRNHLDDPVGFDEGLWSQMAELGWLGIHVPEPYGGGATIGDLAVILIEMGRRLAQSPILGSTVLGASVVAMSDNLALKDELLNTLASGTSRAAVAATSRSGSYGVREISVSAAYAGSALRLNGVAGFVADAHVANVLFVGALDSHGEPLIVVVDPESDGVSITRTPTVDATRRLFQVRFDAVQLATPRLVCEPGAASARLLDHITQLGAFAVCCDALGVAEEMLQRTAEYASNRRQFGRAIGSFQAVKHHCADMAVSVVASRASIDATCAAFDDPDADSARAVAVLKSYVSQACSRACGIAIQVHGGIGFTWENDAHLYFKRAKLDEMLFGSPRWHRGYLANAIFPKDAFTQEQEILGT
jgi:alkylation response protein AidB-like acyl-CoA dehydrogenase